MTRGPSLLVRGASSYPPGPGARTTDVRVVGGVVDAVGPDLEAGGAPVLDAAGRTVIPGVVDVHVHFRDPGLEHIEGWAHGSAGALHGGVTSVVEVQNNPPLSTSREALEARIEHVRASSRVDFGCLANLMPESVPELAAMAPITPAFKCFLGGSTGLGGLLDRDVLKELFAAAAGAGRMIVGHCEDEAILQREKAAHPEATAREHHLVRPTEAEVESIRTSIQLVRETGAEFHVFHLSTAEGADLVRAARAEGLAVSASTAPHFILLSCEDADRLGNLLKVNPSIKTPADGRGILAALADGTIDAIGTDHAPHPLEKKQNEYKHAPSGMPSVDLLWPLTWELVRRGELDAQVALASVTSRAAESLHLPGKGRLAPGYDGDLVLFDRAGRLPRRGRAARRGGVAGRPAHRRGRRSAAPPRTSGGTGRLAPPWPPRRASTTREPFASRTGSCAGSSSSCRVRRRRARGRTSGGAADAAARWARGTSWSGTARTGRARSCGTSTGTSWRDSTGRSCACTGARRASGRRSCSTPALRWASGGRASCSWRPRWRPGWPSSASRRARRRDCSRPARTGRPSSGCARAATWRSGSTSCRGCARRAPAGSARCSPIRAWRRPSA
jgi:dihydroorotase